MEHGAGLGSEMSLAPPGQMTAGVTARHRTLPVLYRRILGPRPEDLGGGVVGDLPVLVVLLGLAVRVAAGLGPAAGLPGDVNTPLHLATSGLLPGGRPLQLSTRLVEDTVRGAMLWTRAVATLKINNQEIFNYDIEERKLSRDCTMYYCSM